MLTADADRPTDPESELLQFRRAEFTIIRREVNDSLRIPNLRVIQSEVSDEIAPWFAKVNLVERLRETRVFYRLRSAGKGSATSSRDARIGDDPIVS